MHNRKINTGLFFGSFNPVHIGHMALVNYIVEYSGLEEVWMVVSPNNPFKNADELIGEQHRLEMVKIAAAGDARFYVSDAEFEMPRPSYTIDTLQKLSADYSGRYFTLIMGGDNLSSLDRWKNGDSIRQNYDMMIYPRTGYPVADELLTGSMTVIDGPYFDISSTLIRKALYEGKNIPFLLPYGVFEYIKRNGLYQ